MSNATRDTTKVKKRPPAPGTPLMVRVQPDQLARLDAYVAQQPEPQPSRPDAIRQLIDLGIDAARQARAKAKSDAADERARNAAQATADYADAKRAETEKTERLRQVRLAKEAHDSRVAANPPPAAMTEKARKKLAAQKPLEAGYSDRGVSSAARKPT